MSNDHDPKHQQDFNMVNARQDCSLQTAFSRFRCEANVAVETGNQAFEEFDKNHDGRMLFLVDSIKQYKGDREDVFVLRRNDTSDGEVVFQLWPDYIKVNGKSNLLCRQVLRNALEPLFFD